MKKGLFNNKIDKVLPADQRKDISDLTEAGFYTRKFVTKRQGNVTVVVATGNFYGNPYTGIGIAQRNPNDQENRKIGNALARSRAVESLLKQIEK